MYDMSYLSVSDTRQSVRSGSLVCWSCVHLMLLVIYNTRRVPVGDIFSSEEFRPSHYLVWLVRVKG